MSSKEKINCLIIIIVFATIFYVFNQRATKKEISIKKNTYKTIGKVFRIDVRRSFTDACYYYYYDGLKYESYQSIKVSGSNYNNRFYRINVSTENASYSKIFLDQEITDSTEIVNAGFKYK
jgi:hypothetical protein